MKLLKINKQFEFYQNALNYYRTKIEKLESKQEELNKREQDILTIKDNTTQILKLLKEQQGGAKFIQSLNKTKEIKHNSYVYSITELSNSRMATGDGNGYIRLFAVDYEKTNGQRSTKRKNMIDILIHSVK